MDVRGNFKWWEHYFPIQRTDILPKSANPVGAVDTAGMTSETLQKISGDDQRGNIHKRLAHPFVVAVRDTDNEPVAGIQVTFQVTIGGGKLSITNPWTDSNGHAQTFLTLGDSLVNRVEAGVFGVSERVIFSTDSQPRVLIAQSQRPPMHWIDTRAGTLHRLVGAKVESLLPSVQNATSLAVDMADEKLYWTEKTSNRTGKIRRANLDGTNVQLVKDLTSVLHSLAINTTNDKLYLTNSWGKIQRLDFDGSNFQPNFITGLDTPEHLALDVTWDKIYWTERAGRIRRANLNGSNLETIATDLGTLGGIVIADDKLYWTEQTDENAGRVQRANLDGSNVQTLASLQSVPLGITIDPINRQLYWTTSQGTIQRANLDGNPDVRILVVGLGTPIGIALSTPVSLEKITGPWLWMIAPTKAGQGGARSTNVDSLAKVSNGAVTETDVAANGAKSGDIVGDYAWPLGEIAVSGGDNVNDLINNVGMAQGDVDDHSAYALITLESATAQPGVTMRVGSDDSIKVWLNGEVVHNNPIDRGAADFQDTFKVNLVAGDNLLLVKVSDRSEHWTMFVGIDADVKTKVPSADPAAAPMRSASEVLLPTETVLLSNYPNPFNPETWIPYQLAEPAEVTLRIYAINGTLIRTLALGHQPAGVYHSRTRAAYWDGRNALGEPVASGLYFYALTAGDFSATRKMLIRK